MTAPVAQRSCESQLRSGAGAHFAEQPTTDPVAKVESAAPHPVDDPPIHRAEARDRPAGRQLLVVPDLSGYAELRIWAETFADQQDHRKRIMNRLGLKADGTEQTTGARVPPDLFAGQVEAIERAEHLTALAMRRCYRRVAPAGVIVWQKSTFGIGEHLLARLLGALGDPRIATPYHWEGEGDTRTLVADEMFERTVRQLWSYCGHGDASRKKRKGMSAVEAFGLGNPNAKMLVHLLAEAAIKCRIGAPTAASAETPSLGTAPGPTISPDPPSAGAEATEGTAGRDSSAYSPNEASTAIVGPASRRYRQTYETRRATTAETRPDWTPGHSHNDALRIVGKHLLADLWEATA